MTKLHRHNALSIHSDCVHHSTQVLARVGLYVLTLLQNKNVLTILPTPLYVRFHLTYICEHNTFIILIAAMQNGFQSTLYFQLSSLLTTGTSPHVVATSALQSGRNTLAVTGSFNGGTLGPVVLSATVSTTSGTAPPVMLTPTGWIFLSYFGIQV